MATDKPVRTLAVGDIADNGYSSRVSSEDATDRNRGETAADETREAVGTFDTGGACDCECPSCKHRHPSARGDLGEATLRFVCDAYADGAFASPLDFVLELSRAALTAAGHGFVPSLACKCPACGWHHTPAAHLRWVDAARALASGEQLHAAAAGGEGARAPGHDQAPDPARVPRADGARLAPAVDGSAAPAPALTLDRFVQDVCVFLGGQARYKGLVGAAVFSVDLPGLRANAAGDGPPPRCLGAFMGLSPGEQAALMIDVGDTGRRLDAALERQARNGGDA